MNDFFNREHVLENDRARLEPLQEKHFEKLLPIALHKELWLYTAAKINSEEDFRKYFNQAIHEFNSQTSYPFAIIDKQENRYAGSTRFGNISLENKRMEIGWTWYHPELQRTGLNRSCKHLLLHYGFHSLGLNRIELKTSLLNLRSQTAMEKIGAVKEGVLRRHMINDDGVVRDTVYYSFIREEWEETRKKFFSKY